ncbi:putative TATA element modulatory factor 1 TATA binding domain-containing protein [Seiridium cardinale]|uniref:TATA element modulatory factor 1 TATA binding domain-containing protein n=1 Tax=Seiridium cardinale TaxID=138064 RepID=A0ABR2XQF2_9PEZI
MATATRALIHITGAPGPPEEPMCSDPASFSSSNDCFSNPMSTVSSYATSQQSPEALPAPSNSNDSNIAGRIALRLKHEAFTPLDAEKIKVEPDEDDAVKVLAVAATPQHSQSSSRKRRRNSEISAYVKEEQSGLVEGNRISKIRHPEYHSEEADDPESSQSKRRCSQPSNQKQLVKEVASDHRQMIGETLIEVPEETKAKWHHPEFPDLPVRCRWCARGDEVDRVPTSAWNPFNKGRIYFSCMGCCGANGFGGFICWEDANGIDALNGECYCGLPARKDKTTRVVPIGREFLTCPVGWCVFRKYPVWPSLYFDLDPRRLGKCWDDVL